MALFDNTLLDHQLDLMRTPLAELTSRIVDIRNRSDSSSVHEWLLIALGHPTTSDEELIHLGQLLGIPPARLFGHAAMIGRLNIINQLTTGLAPPDLLSIIQADEYRAFRMAAWSGALPIIERFIQLAPAELMNMIQADRYGAFGLAAWGGHLAIMERLIALAPAELNPMIQAQDYSAFRKAGKCGHLDIMQRLIELAPTDALAMIQARDYGVFCKAAKCGQLAFMERLIELAPADVVKMIQANDYDAFCQAAAEGHIPVMNRLIELAPTEILNMIRAQDYSAFSGAARLGNLAIMEKLIELAPSEVLNMVRGQDYSAFSEAALEGHLAVIEKLIALVPAEEVLNMVTARNYIAFLWASDNNNLPITNRLLMFSAVLAYFEMHDAEYNRVIYPFIAAKLLTLHDQRHSLETSNPNVIFDITDAEEAKCCFYIIRNLIRRNDATLLDDIRFLLEIPAVKALAHVAVTPGESNELIRLALTTGNAAAAEILLNIPAIRELAARHDYYRTEAHGALDLRALARDRESSMHALTTGEQRRMAAVIAHYQARIHAEGVDSIFNHLREALVRRYQEHPATITLVGVTRILPVAWETFEHFELTTAQRLDALKAYYQHKDHSALRYLSNPNHWMAPNANYVYINPEHTLRWSTFEEYKPLISLLWLAAKDETIAPIDGHTLEGRITHFIDELAHIGRAHNWDHSRDRVVSSGNVISEEFDDLAGDKPSCFSGVKRRLFQSVVGHPLLKILTEQDLQQELRDFVRAHVMRHITDENRNVLRKAWTDYCLSVELADANPLRALNITTEQQAAFVEQLTAKYSLQFSRDAKFITIITKAFTLVESASNPSDCMHALKFAALVNLEQLLPAVTVISMPAETEFRQQVEILARKQADLRGNAAAAVRALHDGLKAAADVYFNHPTKESYNTFKTISEPLLHDARNALKSHHDWQQILVNIALAIAGLGILYILAASVNKVITGNFLFFSTDATRKVDAIERCIEKSKPLAILQ